MTARQRWALTAVVMALVGLLFSASALLLADTRLTILGMTCTGLAMLIVFRNYRNV